MISLPNESHTPVASIHPTEIQYVGGTRTSTLIVTILASSIIVLTIIIAVMYFFLVVPEEQIKATQAAVAEIVGPTEDFTRDTTGFQILDLQADAAVVYDIKEEKVIWGDNADEALPLASLTKLMTALVASETLSPEQEIVITSSAIRANGDSGLVEGETWLLDDLLKFTLITSSNDGAQAVASVAGSLITKKEGLIADNEPLKRLSFVQKMNAKARELGLNSTTFNNASGLDTGISSSGATGSAEDMAHLMAYILKEHPDLLEATREPELELTSLDGSTYSARNTNARTGNIPGLIGSKTGFTHLAGGNLAVAYDNSLNHPVILVVLGSTFEERFTDIEKLMIASRAYFSGAVE